MQIMSHERLLCAGQDKPVQMAQGSLKISSTATPMAPYTTAAKLITLDRAVKSLVLIDKGHDVVMLVDRYRSNLPA